MSSYNFEDSLDKYFLKLDPLSVETLQINITKMCNQACHHCHVNASPVRTEMMSKDVIDNCLRVLEENDSIKKIDITGGAPELHPDFEYLVSKSRKLNKHIMIRHNLTVTFDGNPITKESKEYLPAFFAENKVEVISSLPFHQEFFTDKQRGKGVFKKSIESLKLLNDQGYGKENSGLILNLVYNPVGSFLPASQKDLEVDYKMELLNKFGIVFNNLFTITNMPVNRFRQDLERRGNYEEYMDKLINSFNPLATEGLMCRSLISVDINGYLYDCDFNQMLDLKVIDDKELKINNFDLKKLLSRKIIFDSHCFGCTAGSGSSCTGVTS